MQAAIAASWALLLGIGLMMLGNGLQGSLLGIRASLEGFPTAVTGLVMSAYFVGFLAGSTLAPRLVKRVGHIRVFSALASLASASVLLHAVFLTPGIWSLARLVTGFSYAGLYVVAESWLNDRATNETRGQLLSIYMIITLGSMASGQLLLNLGDPGGYVLFILASVLVSLALVPISLTARPAPSFEAPSHVGLKQLYDISPLGVLGCLATGVANGAFVGMGAVYAENIGLSVAQISIFMAIAIVGGVIFQWPLGHLSDKFDRRRVITVVTFLAALFALIAVIASSISPWVLFVIVCLFGGLSFPMYSLCLAHTNDHLKPDQLVAASGTLVLVVGIGASFGPTTAAALMSIVGANGFFWWLAIVHAAIGVFAIYRMSKRAAPAVEEHTHLIPVSPPASPGGASLTLQTLRDHIDRDVAKMSRV